MCIHALIHSFIQPARASPVSTVSQAPCEGPGSMGEKGTVGSCRAWEWLGGGTDLSRLVLVGSAARGDRSHVEGRGSGRQSGARTLQPAEDSCPGSARQPWRRSSGPSGRLGLGQGWAGCLAPDNNAPWRPHRHPSFAGVPGSTVIARNTKGHIICIKRPFAGKSSRRPFPLGPALPLEAARWLCTCGPVWLVPLRASVSLPVKWGIVGEDGVRKSA